MTARSGACAARRATRAAGTGTASRKRPTSWPPSSGSRGTTIAWQSAGRTGDPWWGPPVEAVIEQLAADGRPAVVVCSAGFVADHLEILYDLDIQAREVAEQAGLRFVRTAMPNDDPAFIAVLAEVVQEQLTRSRA